MAGNTNREIIEVQVKGTKKAKNQLDGVNNTLSKMAKRVGLASAAYFGATGVDLDLEHILPRKHYPELAFDPDNIVTACKCCNKEKANKVGESVGKKILPFQKKLDKKKEKELLEV